MDLRFAKWEVSQQYRLVVHEEESIGLIKYWYRMESRERIRILHLRMLARWLKELDKANNRCDVDVIRIEAWANLALYQIPYSQVDKIIMIS